MGTQLINTTYGLFTREEKPLTLKVQNFRLALAL